jgi:large subunit ribosomal protein L25
MKLEIRTRKLNAVRNELKIPGVMYGKSIESTSVEVDEKAFKEALKTYGKSRTFEVTLGKKKHTVYIKSLQSRVLKPDHIVHFDLHAVSKDDRLTAVIPLVFNGKEELEKKRLYIQTNLQGIECEYAVGSGLDNFTFDVAELQIGDGVAVKDLKLPEGLKVLHEPDFMIFTIKESTMKEETPETDEVEDEDEASTEDSDDAQTTEA